MKIYAISDLHLSTVCDKPMDIFGSKWVDYMDKIKADWNEKVTDDDIVLISGDTSWAMDLDDAVPDFNSLIPLKGKKIFIRGNHDYWWKSISKVRASLPENFYALQNDCLKFGNVIICGSRGWSVEGSPDFKQDDMKIYLREVERLKLAFKCVNSIREEGDEVYCMIHFPPFNVRRENSLFTQLFEEEMVSKVIYGHLHGKDSRADLKVIKNGIEYYLTSCDLVGNKLTFLGEVIEK